MATRTYSVRETNPDNFEALHEGVPVWLKNTLDQWLELNLSNPMSGSNRSAKDSLIRKIERKLRIDLSGGSTGMMMWKNTKARMNSNPELTLDIVSALLEMKGDECHPDILETMLEESGSKWCVRDVDGILCLDERVEGTLSEAFEDAVGYGGLVSKYLSTSWQNTFGRNPDPSVSYSNSIKAVEAALHPFVIPNDKEATLGKMIGHIEGNLGSYGVSIPERKGGLGIEGTIKQLKLVWQGQTDRHGTSNPVTPTQEAAEQALFICLSISQQAIRGRLFEIT